MLNIAEKQLNVSIIKKAWLTAVSENKKGKYKF